MNKIIHFFDLDGTLWSIKNNAWIISKKNPNKPLFKLSQGELSLILSGVFINDELEINYDGNKYWISEELFNKIKKKRPNISPDDIGISFYEEINPDYYKNMKFYKDNIRHLIGVDNVDIGILSARYNDEKDKKLLILLKEELENIGLKIDKFYYVGEYYEPKITSKINIRKSNTLLEHLVGFHIEGDKFVPIKQDLYKEVHFYDDEHSNIQVANNIQELLDGYLKNTEDEVFDRVIKNINKSPILNNHLITNNNLNRFKTTTIKITETIKYPISVNENKVLKFKNFK